MADTDFSSAPKPLIYDLLNRLNAAFARVHRNMEALEQAGIFDPLMMQSLNRQSEQLRARRELSSARSHAPHRRARPGAILATKLLAARLFAAKQGVNSSPNRDPPEKQGGSPIL
ncbi:MAG TPA: hypothetical protein VIJ01_17990 [Candidatus Angelobacter sp.]